MIRALGVDPSNPLAPVVPAVLPALGFHAGRFVIKPETRGYVDDCHAAGLAVWGVFTGESGDIGQYRDWPVDIRIISNEMDTVSKSSETMTPAEFSVRWHRARDVFRDTPLWIGAMASGRPELAAPYIAVADGAVGLCVHPYDKPAEPARVLLRAYKAAYRLPLLVTEWNRPAEEIAEFMVMLEEECEGHSWFCAMQTMVPGFGLLDAPEKLQAWRETIRMPEFILGFKQRAEELGPEIVGQPLEDETYWPDSEHSLQMTSKGFMIYGKRANQVHFIPAAQLPNR